LNIGARCSHRSEFLGICELELLDFLLADGLDVCDELDGLPFSLLLYLLLVLFAVVLEVLKDWVLNAVLLVGWLFEAEGSAFSSVFAAA
jgi:hypothetical protein